MANYIKVAPVVARVLGLREIRNKTKDGNYLLWQADILKFPGSNVFERAAYCGGAVLTPNAAKEEIDGADNPVTVAATQEFINQYGTDESSGNDGGADETSSETSTTEEGSV